jgi:CheY-like chemotaxis protein
MSSIVLIIDDDFCNRLVLREHLKGHGISTIEAENGEKAIAIFKEKSNIINLILIDYKMPLLNGYETLLELKKINNNIKSILITGNYVSLMDKTELSLFDSVLEKPIDFKILMNELEKYGIK